MVENINQFIFKDKKSFEDMHLIITEPRTISSPARRVSYTEITARNGDILSDENCFDNGKVKYKVTAIADNNDMQFLTKKIKWWLQGEAGYFPLSDTYDANYYYLACYDGNIDFDVKLCKLGSTTLTFNVKPFRYSFVGQQEISITAAATITNPEFWESKPYIKIIGNGNITLSINNKSYYFTNIDKYIEIDSEIQCCFKDAELQNTKANFIDFPILAEGKNDISFVGDVSEVIIVPRWCTL